MAFAITGAPFDDSRFETLESPADLAKWAGSIVGATDVEASATDLALAKRVRSAIWGATDAVIEGRPPTEGDRRALNNAAGQAPLAPHLAPDGTSSWRSPIRSSAVISTVARDAIDLFGGPRATRLKRCQGVNCAIPFVDTSRPGKRRWCSMERCGNRAKAKTHYHHHRKEAFR